MNTSSEGLDRLNCNGCQKTTWHEVVGEHILEVPIYDYDEYLETIPQKWDILQCRGCGEITVRVCTEYGGYQPHHEFYPPRTIRQHKRKVYLKLPSHLDYLYVEVVNAINSRSHLLSAAGLRALLEGLCADKGITEGLNKDGKIVKNLEGKINGLSKIVPEGIVRNLHGLRFLGNQALHELEKPEESDLLLALRVLEDIFNIVYDLDYRAQVLFEKTSKDKKSKKKKEDDIPF